MEDRLREWWKGVRRSKTNLVLVVVGCLLILMCPVWAFAVAPWLKVEPTDFEQFSTFDAIITRYLAPPGQPVPPTSGTITNAIIERRIHSRPDLSSSGVSTVQVTTRLLKAGSGSPLEPQSEDLYYLDRRKGSLMTGALSAMSVQGVTALSTAHHQQYLDALGKLKDTGAFYIVFPFDAPKGKVRVWDPPLRTVHPAKYTSTTSLSGLTLYGYSLVFGNQPGARPADFPERMTGAELKAVLQMPSLAVADGDTVTPAYMVSVDQTLLVEPRAGTIAEDQLNGRSVSLTVTLPGGGSVSRLLEKTRYTEQPLSVGAGVAIAREEVAKLQLQFTYLPLGLLVLGVVTLAIGALVGVRPLPEEAEGAEEEGTDARGGDDTGAGSALPGEGDQTLSV